jgi:hypothetical protein
VRTSEARAVVGAVLAGCAGEHPSVGRSVIEELSGAIPGIDWAALAAEVDPARAPLVDVVTLREARGALEPCAASHGLADLRWSPSARVLVARGEKGVGYSQVMAAEREMAEIVGGGVEILLDWSPAALALDDLEVL